MTHGLRLQLLVTTQASLCRKTPFSHRLTGVSDRLRNGLNPCKLMKAQKLLCAGLYGMFASQQ